MHVPVFLLPSALNAAVETDHREADRPPGGVSPGVRLWRQKDTNIEISSTCQYVLTGTDDQGNKPKYIGRVVKLETEEPLSVPGIVTKHAVCCELD